MKLILTLAMMSIIGFAMQTCSKSGVASVPDVAVKTDNKMPTTPAPTAVPDDAPRISLEDAKKDFDKGNVVFIDTRGEDSYKVEHVKGAVNIPAGDFESRYTEVPKDKKIIAYCS